jgi:hypothetical protein
LVFRVRWIPHFSSRPQATLNLLWNKTHTSQSSVNWMICHKFWCKKERNKFAEK